MWNLRILREPSFDLRLKLYYNINSVDITNFTILGRLAGEALAPRPQHQERRHQGGPLYNVQGYVTT